MDSLLCAVEVVSDAVASLLLAVHLLSIALLFLLCKVGITFFAVDHPLIAVVKLLCAAFQLNTLP